MITAILLQAAAPFLRAVEQPKPSFETFENPPPQPPQVIRPESRNFDRRRSQIGTLVFFVFIAPWRAFTWSHSTSSMIRRCGTATVVTQSSGFSREFRLPLSGCLLKCRRFQTRRPI